MPKVLIADDKSINCSMLFQKLHSTAGVDKTDIIIAASGNDAISKGKAVKDDSVIAILDMNMKDGDGADAATALRAHHKDNITIYIWSTGNPSKDVRFNGLNVIFVDAVNSDKVVAINTHLQDIASLYRREKLRPLTIPPPTITSTPTTPSLTATAVDFVFAHPYGISTPRSAASSQISKTPAFDDKKADASLPSIDGNCSCCQCDCLCSAVRLIKKFVCG